MTLRHVQIQQIFPISHIKNLCFITNIYLEILKINIRFSNRMRAIKLKDGVKPTTIVKTGQQYKTRDSFFGICLQICTYIFITFIVLFILCFLFSIFITLHFSQLSRDMSLQQTQICLNATITYLVGILDVNTYAFLYIYNNIYVNFLWVLLLKLVIILQFSLVTKIYY